MVGYLHWIHLPMLAQIFAIQFSVRRWRHSSVHIFNVHVQFLFLQRNRSLSYGWDRSGDQTAHWVSLYLQAVTAFERLPIKHRECRNKVVVYTMQPKNSWIFIFDSNFLSSFTQSTFVCEADSISTFNCRASKFTHKISRHFHSFSFNFLLCASQLYLRSDHWKNRVKIASLNRPTYSVRAEVTNETERETREKKSL